MARLIGQKAMNLVVSHIEGVVEAVAQEARKIGKKAEARLAAHRSNDDSEHHTIDVEHHKVDSVVVMDGPAPLSLEFGHDLVLFGVRTGRHVQGRYIVTGAAGLLD